MREPFSCKRYGQPGHPQRPAPPPRLRGSACSTAGATTMVVSGCQASRTVGDARPYTAAVRTLALHAGPGISDRGLEREERSTRVLRPGDFNGAGLPAWELVPAMDGWLTYEEPSSACKRSA